MESAALEQCKYAVNVSKEVYNETFYTHKEPECVYNSMCKSKLKVNFLGGFVFVGRNICIKASTLPDRNRLTKKYVYMQWNSVYIKYFATPENKVDFVYVMKIF
jgi:hypothetical protein